jgi:SP family general alpha glucoside:H+ symporter-like MFS transporter
MVIIFFAPESPYWLVRKGRTDEALRSVQRLNGTSKQEPKDVLAMVERTVEIEAKMGGTPTLLDLFRGVDRRRTLIICFIYASQNFAGNLIANQATFFFERESIPLAP